MNKCIFISLLVCVKIWSQKVTTDSILIITITDAKTVPLNLDVFTLQYISDVSESTHEQQVVFSYLQPLQTG